MDNSFLFIWKCWVDKCRDKRSTSSVRGGQVRWLRPPPLPTYARCLVSSSSPRLTRARKCQREEHIISVWLHARVKRTLLFTWAVEKLIKQINWLHARWMVTSPRPALALAFLDCPVGEGWRGALLGRATAHCCARLETKASIYVLFVNLLIVLPFNF